MGPTHCWMFPSKWKHLTLNRSKPDSPQAPHRSVFPLCSLSRQLVPPFSQRQEPDMWDPLPSRHQVIPNSPSLPWFKARVLTHHNRLFQRSSCVQPILKSILDPATSGIHPECKADHMPAAPHSRGMHSRENQIVGRQRPSQGEVGAWFPVVEKELS